MTPTTLVNLALSKIGQTLIKAIGDTTSKEARLASLHYEPTLREVLRAHFWGFTLCPRPLVAVDTRIYLTITGPMRVGSTNLTFPRLYLAQDEFNGHVRYDEILDADDIISAPCTVFWSEDDACWMLLHGGTLAIWKRGIDMPGPEQIALRPDTPPHTLETNLTGANNDLIFQQREQFKAPVSIQYNTPGIAAASPVQVIDRAIIITLGTKARMLVSGVTTADVNGWLIYAGTFNDRPCWTSDGLPPATAMDGRTSTAIIYSGVFTWNVTRRVDGVVVYSAHITTDVPYPDGLTYSAPIIGAGTPTVAPGVALASQIRDRISATPEAHALVSTSYPDGNDGSGAVTSMPRATLSGGLVGTPTLARIDPTTEFLGWSHAFELPDNFVKAKTLYTADGREIDKFTLRRVAGKPCILCNHPAVSLEYVQYIDDPDIFDPLFIAAFVTLLASKLARAITGSDDMEAKFLQFYNEVDLPAARTASGQETDSKENHPLREFLNGNLTPGRIDFFGRLDD